MNANELAEAMEIRASIRRKATSRKSVTEGANDRLADQLEQAATMLRQQQVEIAELKHMNKNWSISEGWALQEIELMKHFLQANQLYLSFEEWKHGDSARTILRKAQEK